MAKIIALNLIIVHLLSSCASVKNIDPVVRDVPGSKQKTDDRYSLEKIKSPTYKSPLLTLAISREGKYEYEQERTQRKQYDRSSSRTFASAIGVLAGLVGLFITAGYEYNGEPVAGDAGTGIPIVAGGVLFYVLYPKKDKIVDDVKESAGTREEWEQVSAEGERVKLSIGKTEVYKSIKNQQIKLDLIKDLQLDFDTKDSTVVELSYLNKTSTIELSHKDWLIQRGEIIEDVVCVRKDPSYSSEGVFGLEKGSTFLIRSIKDTWVSISSDDGVGYIPRTAVKAYYSRNDLENLLKSGCTEKSDLVKARMKSIVEEYYGYLQALGKGYSSSEKKTIMSNALALFGDNITVPNDIDATGGQRIKYRKIKEYLRYVSAKFETIYFDSSTLDFKLTDNQSWTTVRVNIKGIHPQEGSFDLSRNLKFLFKSNTDGSLTISNIVYEN